MLRATVDPPWELNAWRTKARAALRAEIPPDVIVWNGDDQGELLAGTDVEHSEPKRPAPLIDAEFITLAAKILCHRDAQRHALLYRMAFRIANGEKHLLSIATDPDVRRATALEQAVRRDAHKMKAFVRFREIPGTDENFIAWFEPDHFIVDRIASFFAKRFTGMHWAILTPYRSVAWNRESLIFLPGAQRSDAPADDARDDLWRTYYANIFNPARLNPKMMTKEMPTRYWKNLPEATLLPTLIGNASQRVAEMAERDAKPARRRIPVSAPTNIVASLPNSIDALRDAARQCRACPLWEPATQTVFGEGPANARIVIVGEQPGDREDVTGHPFVGPAGQLLDRAFEELKIDRSRIYLTNAVKHFRFEFRGKRRLHRSPDAAHVRACQQWLEGEIRAIDPHIVVCLGATAASAVFDRKFRLMDERGEWFALGAKMRAFATVHPAWILRQPTETERERAFAGFVADLSLLVGETQDKPPPTSE
jgi:uracil-DNA glycosylase